jgi:hypothetical protein
MKKYGTESTSSTANEIQATDLKQVRTSSRRSSRSLVSKIKPELVKSDSVKMSPSESMSEKTIKNKRKSDPDSSTTVKDTTGSLKRKVVDRDGSIDKAAKTTKSATNRVDRVHHQKYLHGEPNDSDSDDEYMDASSDDDCGNDEFIDDDEGYVGHRQKRRRTKTLSSSEGSWECPHCNKKFGSALGLQYHTDRFVCQPALRPGGAVIRKGRRKIIATIAGDDNGTQPSKAYNKIRGKINDRTCPQCRRVFTSIAGMQYHLGASLRLELCRSLQTIYLY